MTDCPFNFRSYCGVTWKARQYAMAGWDAEEISKMLGMHILACQRIVNECLKHKAEFQAAVKAGE